MIFQRLAEYYDRLVANRGTDSEMAMVGFSRESISFCLVLKPDGTGDLQDLREVKGKRGAVAAILQVPHYGEKRTANDRPFFLWDNTEYVFGIDKDGKQTSRSLRRFGTFRDFHLSLRAAVLTPEFDILCKFLEAWNPQQFETLQYATEASGTNIIFKVAGELAKLHEMPESHTAWNNLISKREAIQGQSLVSGLTVGIARLHPAIKGVFDPGGQAEKGFVVINKDKTAFESYGKQQSYNAPVGVIEAAKYSNALNYLLSSRRALLGDATFTYWSESPTLLEEYFDPILGDMPLPKSDAPAEDKARSEQVKAFFAQLRDGHAHGDAFDRESKTPFYILGLSPNAARLSVRFWEQTTVGEMAVRLKRFMRSVEIVGIDLSYPVTVRRMVNSTARIIGDKPDYDSISPRLSGEVIRAVLSGGRLPNELMATILGRIHADAQVTPLRAAVLKAFVILNGNILMEPYLNKSHTEPAYHCGRLLAVLAFAQDEALGAVNSGVIRRMLGSVMATPGLQLGRLQRAAEVGHIPKLKRNLPQFVRDELKHINGSLKSDVPLRLSPLEQSIFMLGFYQQLQFLDFTSVQVNNGKRVPTSQGEWVRSNGEKQVAELLTKQGIRYTYEPSASLPSGPDRWPDFVVSATEKKEFFYIEYLGMDTAEYDTRWEQKVKAYAEGEITEAGGSNGKLVIIDGRKQRLDDIAIMHILERALGLKLDPAVLVAEGESK